VNSIPQVILNPVAGSGAGGRLQAAVERSAGARWGRVDLNFTSRQGEATELARNAVARGASLIIACGGDGTVQEVVNGMLGAGVAPLACELGIVNCGTGRGLADSLDLPETLEQQLNLIHHGEAVALDVGRVKYVNGDGRTAERLFVNECQLGIGGAVVERLEARKGGDRRFKRLGGTLAFGLVAVRELVRLRSPELVVEFDGGERAEGRFLGVVVGNGAKCGGGMRLTPEAAPDDGALDVVLIREMAVPLRLWTFFKIYKGRHTEVEGISSRRCRKLSVSGVTTVEADGELLGTPPCTIEVLPGALHVKAPKGAGVERR
jgi:diacylglycerol kinase (ATP)